MTTSNTATVEGGADACSRVVRSVVEGLGGTPARIEPKHFYDRLGSALFAAICELDEYYPTRVERGILEAAAPSLVARVGTGTVLVDLGAGDCAKARRLLPALRPAAYVPVDISVDYVSAAAQALAQANPALPVAPVGCDLSEAWRLPEHIPRARRLFFYPGSSIGNFVPDEAVAFLSRVRDNGDDDALLLIGVDLVKEAHVLDRAYDDALGVTAAFNLNILRNVNRLIGADFDPAHWRHVAFYAGERRRIEMHLEAREPVAVAWRGGGRRFAAGERIHTESSYKYEVPAFEALLTRAGWRTLGHWTDERGWFAVFLAHAGGHGDA